MLRNMKPGCKDFTNMLSLMVMRCIGRLFNALSVGGEDDELSDDGNIDEGCLELAWAHVCVPVYTMIPIIWSLVKFD